MDIYPHKQTSNWALGKHGVAERAYIACNGIPTEYSYDYKYVKDSTGKWHDIRVKKD